MKNRSEKKRTRPSRPICAPSGSSNQCVPDRQTSRPTDLQTDGPSLLLMCVGAYKDREEKEDQEKYKEPRGKISHQTGATIIVQFKTRLIIGGEKWKTKKGKNDNSEMETIRGGGAESSVTVCIYLTRCFYSIILRNTTYISWQEDFNLKKFRILLSHSFHFFNKKRHCSVWV